MKYIKMLGLAAVAAAALMAFVGASSASATVLCKTNVVASETGKTCAPGWAYEAKTEIHAVNEGNAILTGPKGTVQITCEESTMKGTTENEGSATETVEGPIEVLTFQKCGNRTVEVLKPGRLQIHWIKGTHNGTLTSIGAEVTVIIPSIFGNIHCIFVTGEGTDIGTLTGGNPATLDAEEAALKQLPTSSLCPSESFWDAKYEVTTPKPLYVANET